MAEITEETIAELETLHTAAFRAPWTYARWEVECGSCEGGSDEPETGCPDPDCDGAHVPIVQVDSPEEYPNGQTVAQISVPGLLCLADKNGALIVALRNAAPELIAAARRSLAYEAFFKAHGAVFVGTLAAALDEYDQPGALRLAQARTEAAYDATKALLERLK